MKIDELRKLPDDQVLKIVRARLSELKEKKLGTSAFRNSELDMDWGSVGDYLREIGYKIVDRSTYEIARFQRKGEHILTDAEYQEYKNMKMQLQDVKEKNRLLDSKIKSNSSAKDKEKILGIYTLDETENFYAKVSSDVVSKWKEFASTQIYSKRCLLELALLNLMDSKSDAQETLDYVRQQKKEKSTTSISINISCRINEKWKQYCSEVMVFTSSQLVAVALMKYMNQLVD